MLLKALLVGKNSMKVEILFEARPSLSNKKPLWKNRANAIEMNNIHSSPFIDRINVSLCNKVYPL